MSKQMILFARINKFLTKLSVKGLANTSLLNYVKCGVTLLDFVSKSWDDIETKIKYDSNIPMNIWAKIRTQLEEI